jgi:PKD repeat protein
MAYDFRDYSSVHVQFKYKAEGASAWNETGWVTQTGSGSHSFPEPIASLSSNMTYYFMALLKYDGTVLNGTEISFATSGEPKTPTVTTENATNITVASAILNMTYDFMDYSSVHVQFKYMAEGTSAWNETGWVAQSGSGTHSFSESIAGLSSNKTYYFMALLLYDGTVLTSTENSFTTSVEPRPPTFSTKNATNITTAAATLNMAYDFMDYNTVLVQFRYKAEGASAWNETGWVAQSGLGTHSFSEQIAGLYSNKTYYFMALLKYDSIVLTNTENSFTTSVEPRPPTVSTKNATNITTAAATLNMTYDFMDYSSVQVQFKYKAEGTSAWNETGWIAQSGSGSRSFSEPIAGLSSGTTYYFMAQLKYDSAMLNGTENSFTTSGELRQPVDTILIYNADAVINLTASTPPDDTLNSSDAPPQEEVKTILIYNADAVIDLTASTPPDDALNSSDALPQEEVKTILIYNADAVINLTASTPPEDALNSSDALPQEEVKTILIYNADATCDLNLGTVSEHPPTANAGESYSGSVNEDIQFFGSGTDQDGDAIIAYAWDFNNDEIIDSTLQNPTHSWPTAGTYYPTLQVQDETERWSGWDWCEVNVYELVPHLGPYPRSSYDKYYIRIYNIDDIGNVSVNGELVTSVNFGQDSGPIDITDNLYLGDNEIRFTVENLKEGYTFGFEIIHKYKTDRRSQKIFYDSCGLVGVEGCKDSQQTGIVYDRTIILELEEREFSDFTFVQLTDVHIGYTVESMMKFAIALEEVNEMNPDFILVTGDLVEWNESTFFMAFNGILESLDILSYFIPGNHDRRTWLCGGDDALAVYHKYINPSGVDNYCFEEGEYLFIGLDSGKDLHLVDPFPEGSGLSEEQMNYIYSEAIIGHRGPKIVFMHHPAINDEDTVFGDYAPGGNRQCIGEYRDDFISYCVAFNVQLVLTGHTHEQKNFKVLGDTAKIATENDEHRPLFIQTLSATKTHGGSGPGLGYIKVNKNKATYDSKGFTTFPKEVITSIAGIFTPHAYDSEGRHTGWNDAAGYVERNIPGSYHTGTYEGTFLTPTQVLVLFADDYYKIDFTLTPIKIKGKVDDEAFSSEISIRTYDDDTFTDLYYNVTITQNGTASIILNQTVVNYTMEIDYDGDGEIDEYQSPDSIETNSAPTATIISPENNSIFVHGDEITFTGTGTDPEEGVLTDLSLVWSSDTYGIIGTGNEFSTFNLSAGTHKITLRVNDSAGLSGLDSIEITVNAPDLTLNSADISFANPTEDEIIPINVTVHNIGFVKAANVTVHIFDGFPEFQISNLTVNSISVGESRTVNATWNITGKMGNHTISVMIDPDDLIEEMNETDNQASRFIVVAKNEPPIASFTYSPEKPGVNQTITFNASNSTDPDGKITKYEWDFGDGNITNTTEKVINHSYSLAGDYIVNLTVTDNDDATNISMARITVSSMPDLVITEKWLCWPDNCTICYNVTNTGDGTAPACHNTTLYVDGVEVAHDRVPVDLAPGESYTGCFNGYVWGYTPPSDEIRVCADNNESLDELDEDNNCLTNIWMCGDVNCDSKVTMSDVRKVFNRYLDPNYPLDLPWAADANGDGKVTMSDVRKVFNRYLDPGYELNCCCESGVDSAWEGS